MFVEPAEADETYGGGTRKNMSQTKRGTLTGHGPVGKVAIVGIKDRPTNKYSPHRRGQTL